MNNTSQVDSVLIERARRYYPFVIEKADRLIQISCSEILAELSDGSTVMYDDVDHEIRKLPNDSSNMSEYECRHEFAVRLRKIMAKQGISSKQLSEETGISEVTLSYYITGKRTASFYNVDKIAKALNCHVDDLRYY